ncbi:MAG: hypothetical protein H8E40_04965 [Chloroflexi bacterium]|nr:hypothetical protein [Chloroflexota bacterium]
MIKFLLKPAVSDPPSEKQAYAVPVYEFKGQCLDKSGRHLEDFTAWTEALSSTY